jgi:hypothetical protein
MKSKSQKLHVFFGRREYRAQRDEAAGSALCPATPALLCAESDARASGSSKRVRRNPHTPAGRYWLATG